MAKLTLNMDEFYNEDFHLIAVHSAAPNYQLAFLLNKALHLNLTRLPEDIMLNNNMFPIFEGGNTVDDAVWVLAENKSYNQNTAATSNTLFALENEIIATKSYLLKRLKNVDYLIKISNTAESFNVDINLKKIQAIPQVITCYSITKQQLKKQAHLIF